MHEPTTVDGILEDWLTAGDQGREIDEAALIHANPEHRRELERCFEAQARLRASVERGTTAEPGVPLRTVRPERYKDFHLLGMGGMGVVYRALDLRLNAEVALKALRTEGVGSTVHNAPASPFDLVLPPAGSQDAQRCASWRSRFLQEVSITGSLAHPNIVPIYDVAQTENGVPFYTMRYYRGLRTLATAMEDLRDQNAADRLILLEPFLKVCNTIRYAHSRGVVHRDLKPENVLMGEFGEVIVVDWGLAALEGTRDAAQPAWKQRVWEHRHARGDVTQRGAVGTRGYMAPEAGSAGFAQADVRMDVYSLGAVLFEILNGWVPHEDGGASSATGVARGSLLPAPAEFHPAAPRGLQRICSCAMSAARDDRYPTAGALADAIRAWLLRVAARDAIEGSLDATQEALRVAESVHGEERLVASGYARELLAPAAALESPDPRVEAHASQVARLWQQGLKEHGRRKRWRDVAVILLLALAAVLALGWAMCSTFRLAAVGHVSARASLQTHVPPGVRSTGTPVR